MEKILVDCRVFSTPAANKGMGRYSLQILKDFISNNSFHITLLTYPDCKLELSFFELNNISRIETEYSNERLEINTVLEEQARLNKILLKGKFDSYLDLTPFVGPAHLDLLVKKNLSVAYDLIPMLYPTEYLSNFSQRYHYALQIRKLSRSDLIISISQQTTVDLTLLLNIPRNKICVIPPEVDEDYGSEIIEINEIGGYDLVTMVAGHRSKSPLFVHSLIENLHSKLPSFRSAIIFSNIDQARKVNALEWNVPNLKVLYDVPEKLKIILQSKARICLHASAEEGFGIPLLEYLKLGKAIVAADTPVNREIAGTAPVYFKSGDLDSAVIKILELYSDPDVLESMEHASKLRINELKRLRRDETSKDLNAKIRSLFDFKTEQAEFGMVAPLPPIPCGIVDYSDDLISGTFSSELTVFTDKAPFGSALNPKNRLQTIDDLENEAFRPKYVFFQIAGVSWFARILEKFIDLEYLGKIAVIHDMNITSSLIHLWGNELADRNFQNDVLEYEQPSVKKSEIVKFMKSGRYSDAMKVADDLPMNSWLFANSLHVVNHTTFCYRLDKNPPKRITMGVADPLLKTRMDKFFARRLIGLNQDSCVIVIVGIISANKQIDKILKAASFFDEIKLLFVGGFANENYKNEIDTMISSLGIKSKVYFTGYVSSETLSINIRAADIAVVLRDPIREGMSAALLRILAHGVPVVATALDEWKFLESGGIVWVSKTVTPESLHETIANLLENSEKLDELSRNARCNYLRHHTIQSMVASYEETTKGSTE